MNQPRFSNGSKIHFVPRRSTRRTFRKANSKLFAFLIVGGLLVVFSLPMSEASRVAPAPNVIQGANVKVTLDNNNVDGVVPTPSFDARNRGQEEVSVAVDPVNPNIVAIASIDARLVTAAWIGVNVSSDSGASWFNTLIPGFLSDTSVAGLASPLKGRTSSGDPTVRFDGAGNLYVSGVAVTRRFTTSDVPDNFVYVAKYNYTPGTLAVVSTPNAAGNPPNFTYAFTTIVEAGSIAFELPPTANIDFAGQFEDKPWLAIDTNPASPCSGNVYVAHTTVTIGGGPVVISRSTDQGLTFSQPVPLSVRGADGTKTTTGANIGIGADGRVYVSYQEYGLGGSLLNVDIARSDDCGRHFGKPTQAVSGFPAMSVFESGLNFRTPTIPWVAVDDTNSNTVYVAYASKTGSPANGDVFVARSTDGGTTWEAPVKVNDDTTAKHQFFPTIAVSKGALHIGWYDFRDSPNPASPSATNIVLNVYYASSNTSGIVYPSMSQNVKVTDVGFNPECIGVLGFIGDYIEIAATFDGIQHRVHVAWADGRDIPPSKCFGFSQGDFFSGAFNQNIYSARLLVSP